MRLTLRTLLAYLDGILEPNDAQELGKKIEESEYATGLIHRIRDAMQRLRLGAPSLTDRSPKFDPNTVAEYLDNTLDSEGVTDFEKVCLDSDVHLAEVASCHQILTLVLGEPAEIDPASRQRMYQLKDSPASAEPPPTPDSSMTASPPALDVGRSDVEWAERKARPRPTVPEYLREPRRKRRWLPAAVVALVACFVAVLMMASEQFEPGTPLGNLLVQWGVVEPSATQEELAAVLAEARPEKKAEPSEKVLTPSAESSVEPARQPAVEAGAKPAEETAERVAVPPGPETAEEPLPEPEKTTAEPPTTDLVIKTPVDAEPGVAGVPSVESAEQPAKEPPGDAVADANAKPLEEAATAAGEGDEKPAVAPLPPEPLGRLMSSEQVLLKDDAENGWIRATANQMLTPQRLLVLPTYRAKITLTVGVTLEVLGGTQIELLGSGPQQLPGIRVFRGRVVMMPLAQSGSRLRVAFGDRSGVLTFLDAESVAALEVRHIHLPGANPEAGSPRIVAKLYASTGGVSWDEIGPEGAEKPLRLAATQAVVFDAGLTSEPAVAEESPSWIAAEPLGTLERKASAAVASLPTDRPARIGLLELATSRPQKEVRWLALRCLSYVGQFRDLVTALNDPARKLEWPEHIELLREAVARNSEAAAAVRIELEKQYPEQSPNLYRMLLGYSDNDLQSGADEDLVKALDDETLAVRVLGSWNLTDLTGLGGWSYRPEQTAAKRAQPTQRWKQRLKAGEIRLKTSREKAGDTEEKPVPPPKSE